MNEVLEQKINEWLDTVTAESILKDCEDFDIELEDIEQKK